MMHVQNKKKFKPKRKSLILAGATQSFINDFKVIGYILLEMLMERILGGLF